MRLYTNRFSGDFNGNQQYYFFKKRKKLSEVTAIQRSRDTFFFVFCFPVVLTWKKPTRVIGNENCQPKYIRHVKNWILLCTGNVVIAFATSCTRVAWNQLIRFHLPQSTVLLSIYSEPYSLLWFQPNPRLTPKMSLHHLLIIIKSKWFVNEAK